MKAGVSTRNKDFDSNADDSNPDESIIDESTPDELHADKLELIPDEVIPDRSNNDDPNPDNQIDSNATVEGEQHQDNSVADLHQKLRDTGSEDQESANPDKHTGNILGEVSNSGGASNRSSVNSNDDGTNAGGAISL